MLNRPRFRILLVTTFIQLGLQQIATAAPPLPLAPDPAAPAIQFIDLLVKADFATAAARLDTAMTAVMPEAKLRDTWQTLLTQVGAFQKILRAQSGTQGGYKIVLVTCQFEKAAINVRVVLDAKDQVSGLFFAAVAPDASAFKAPPYAKADAYTERDFTVGTGEWQLPGTLTMPIAKTPAGSPAVVLVHGSGPGDRDETVSANKPFRDLAWGLATRGIAVLRYEKRTRQYGEKIAANAAGLTVKEETIDDALAAAAQLRHTDGIDPKRVFILGHSLGATVMPRIGQADPSLAGVILLAGATRPLEDLVVEQAQYMATLAASGKPLGKEDQAQLEALRAAAERVKKLTATDAGSKEVLIIAAPTYWLDLAAHDELAIAKTLKMPMFIAQGARDYQVTTVDFDNWNKALGGQANVTFKLYPTLNHLFIAGTGAGKSKPSDYDVAANVDGQLIDDLAVWILKPPASLPPSRD